jgi:DNA-binding HxlR family transcriptional regulator
VANSATVTTYSGQYCPLAKAAEMLGDRWTLLIVRDILTGAHRFSEIERGLPGISPTLLAQRLRTLERYGIVERRPTSVGRPEYWLTAVGQDLEPAVLGLGSWAARHFGHEPSADDLNSSVLILWVERFLHAALLPNGRHVARFDFTAPRRESRWLLIDRGEATACDHDPGPEPALVVTTDLRTLHNVFAGRIAMRAALREGALRIDGEPDLVRSFPRWFGFSPFAEETRAALRRGA